MNGRRLKVARMAAGYSQRGLAARIGNQVTAQAISKYERDASTPGSAVVSALADALEVSEAYLFSFGDVALEHVEFRTKRNLAAREQARIRGRVVHAMERYLFVEELLGLATGSWDRPMEAPWPVERRPSDAEGAAYGLRALWGLGLDPIPGLSELMERRGVKLLYMDLPEIDGLTAIVQSNRWGSLPVVVVNKHHWGERQRFTIAHELGHMMLSTRPNVDSEAAANYFAGAFLMPAEILRAEIGRRRSSIGMWELFNLKRLLGVSVQALARRCVDLGIIRQPLLKHLYSEFTRFGWRTPPFREPFAMEREQSGRFERLCCRALSQGALSEAKAAELLELSVRELDRRMELSPDGWEGNPVSK